MELVSSNVILRFVFGKTPLAVPQRFLSVALLLSHGRNIDWELPDEIYVLGNVFGAEQIRRTRVTSEKNWAIILLLSVRGRQFFLHEIHFALPCGKFIVLSFDALL